MRVNESPVCLINRPAVEWLVCFVPPNDKQWWHKFLRSPLKHCFLLRCVDENRWLLFEPWWSRVLLTTLTWEEASLFLDWAEKGVVMKVKEHIPGRSSQLRGWMTCAALCAHILGRRYWVWTPAQLLKKLQNENG